MSSKQPILTELQDFVNGVNCSTGINQPLIKSSLVLLSSLPACRNIVFDFFSVIFDLSVEQYMISLERDGSRNDEDETISEIQDALEALIRNGAKAWTGLIANWSLILLGKLSDKHSRRRTMDIGTACTLWLASPAMRCLLGLAALCFEKLDSDETEICITNLLATFVEYSPQFDWVVARLGGCFPLKVISKILQCGLKGFSGNPNTTLDSEIGILGYLSCSHETELVFALKEMIEDVHQGNNAKTFTVHYSFPYILHLAEMSEVLSQTIVDIFLKIFSDDFELLILSQFKKWPANWNIPYLIPILSNLILKTAKNGTTLLLLIATKTTKYNWCKELLELTLVELENKAFDDAAMPMLKDLCKNSSKKELWGKCFSDDLLAQQVAVRVLLLCSYRNPTIFSQTISQLLDSEAHIPPTVVVNSLRRFTSLPLGVNNFYIKNGILLAFQKLTYQKDKTENFKSCSVLFKNLINITNVEKSNSQGSIYRKHLVHHAIASCLEQILLIWKDLIERKNNEKILQKEQFSGIDQQFEKKIKTDHLEEDISKLTVDSCSCREEDIHLTAELIYSLDLRNQNINIKLSTDLLLTQLTVKYFFLCLIENKHLKTIDSIQRCLALISSQCSGKKACQSMGLRELLEGALFTHRDIFGAQLTDEPFMQNSKEYSLLKANQEQEASTVTFRSLILHAGIIGTGPKLPQREANGPETFVKNMFMNAIEACCTDKENPKKIDGYNHISLLLIEYLSTDVMYNGLIWPEEEFTKVTMERDLQMRRAFLSNPILWSILGLISNCRPSLCICSVILRALCASVLHQWRAKSAENINSSGNFDIMQVTVRLLKLLSMSQMLPPPLDYLYIVIQKLEPPEIAYLIKECVWSFMKDFVPSPLLFGCDLSGLHWRDPTVARPPAKFIDPLRNTMQKNIKLFGPLFYKMFSMSELQDN